MPKTLFQRIIDREIPAKIEYEDDQCIVLHDIQPQAPVHLLIIPKAHVTRASEATPSNDSSLGHLISTSALVAKKLSLSSGYRLVINSGPDAGESVPHLHVHLLAGRPLAWPPG